MVCVGRNWMPQDFIPLKEPNMVELFLWLEQKAELEN
jgi:hypothetical protein